MYSVVQIFHTHNSFLFCRTGSYELSEAESVERGTKIVLHLKGDCYDYAKENIVKGIELIYSETCVK
jgi:HSP90 family molecular chaperone